MFPKRVPKAHFASFRLRPHYLAVNLADYLGTNAPTTNPRSLTACSPSPAIHNQQKAASNVPRSPSPSFRRVRMCACACVYMSGWVGAGRGGRGTTIGDLSDLGFSPGSHALWGFGGDHESKGHTVDSSSAIVSRGSLWTGRCRAYCDVSATMVLLPTNVASHGGRWREDDGPGVGWMRPCHGDDDNTNVPF